MQNVYYNRKSRLIPAKWYGAVWALLVVASLVRNIVNIVAAVREAVPDGAAAVTLNVVVQLLFGGIIPAALCFLCATVVFSMSARRGFLYCDRNDFVYLTMLFTAGARMLMGIIESGALVTPAMLDYTSVLLDVTVLSAALYAMYFAVLKPRFMDVRTSFEVFNIYSMIYLIFQGLHTVVPCTVYLMLAYGTRVGDTFLQALEAYTNTTVIVNDDLKYACIAALCVFAAWVVASIVISAVLMRRAKNAPSVVPPSERHDDGSPFDDFRGPDNGNDEGNVDGKKDDKVFEEFDL